MSPKKYDSPVKMTFETPSKETTKYGKKSNNLGKSDYEILFVLTNICIDRTMGPTSETRKKMSVLINDGKPRLK